ncbi:MAG: M15 family metallopeptidase [Lachnospiraceae bacterium]|nr:M15 family metallopeptidase [Lachnospiraceae bacterium]
MAALILAMMISPLNLSAEEKEISGADFSQDDWRLILVNKQHPIPWDYEIKLGTIHNGQRVDERIVTDLEHMLEAAKEDGIRLLVISPYRSSEKQQELFLQKVNRAMRKGESFLSAYRDTAQAVTVPGSSEHEIGLAVDITTKEHITLDEEYADSEGGRWLYENCSDYGFILRYPEGSEEITGIEFEPWHFRYVGKEAAKYLMENKLTLEQLWDEMRQANE